MLWRPNHSALAVNGSVYPCVREVDQRLFLFFGFGLASPTHRLLGVLTELISLAIASGLIIAGFAALQVAPPASSQTGPDWVQLFDGRSLNGWDQVGTANWRVEDGAIMADKSTAPPGAKGQAGGGGRHCESPRDCGTMAPGAGCLRAA